VRKFNIYLVLSSTLSDSCIDVVGVGASAKDKEERAQSEQHTQCSSDGIHYALLYAYHHWDWQYQQETLCVHVQRIAAIVSLATITGRKLRCAASFSRQLRALLCITQQ
jgi:hypothetical protein